MALLELFLILVLQFKGISGKQQYFYHKPGNDVILPCDEANGACSIIKWIYNKYPSRTTVLVNKGHVDNISAMSSRLSLYSNCSLGIKNITAEDAGYYDCLDETGHETVSLSEVFLNILTLSASPSHTDSKTDADVTLECSLFRYFSLLPCEQNSIRWVDETGTVLPNSLTKTTESIKCVSLLPVKHQSGHNKRYTCQFVKENRVKIEADYPPVIEPPSNTAFIIIGAVTAVLVLAVITAVFIKYRRRSKVTEDVQKPSQCIDEPQSNITYATIDHANNKVSPKETDKKEEAVTYSAVKTKAESDPNSFYSTIS